MGTAFVHITSKDDTMATNDTLAAPAATRGRAVNIALWTAQILLAVFFLVAAAGPKLVGQHTAMEIFAQIGLGQWFRYLVGILELAGALGLLVTRWSGLAALGLAGVMVGAALTQVFVLGSAVMAITPAVLCVVFVLIAWGRRPETTVLTSALRR
jgi:putative oxidoreductase